MGMGNRDEQPDTGSETDIRANKQKDAGKQRKVEMERRTEGGEDRKKERGSQTDVCVGRGGTDRETERQRDRWR